MGLQTTWTVLGSSAGHAKAGTASSSYLLESPELTVLFDCGDGATGVMLEAGKKPEAIDHIVLTHTHSDHICGFPYLIQQMYLRNARGPLHVHVPDEALAFFRQLLNVVYMFEENMPFEIVWHGRPDNGGQVLSDRGVTVTAHPTSHLVSQREFAAKSGRPNRGVCHAMAVTTRDARIVYSADIGGLHDLDRLVVDLDLLVTETTHVPLAELWPWLATRRVRRVVLSHLMDGFDATRIVEAAKFTDSEIVVAKDGLSVWP